MGWAVAVSVLGGVPLLVVVTIGQWLVPWTRLQTPVLVTVLGGSTERGDAEGNSGKEKGPRVADLRSSIQNSRLQAAGLAFESPSHYRCVRRHHHLRRGVQKVNCLLIENISMILSLRS